MRKAAWWLVFAMFLLASSSFACTRQSSRESQTVNTEGQAADATATAQMAFGRYEVLRFVGYSSFQENMYLFCDTVAKQALIIDPGGRNSELEAQVQARGLTVVGILDTHGHLDHTAENGFYRSQYGVDVYGESADSGLYLKQNVPTVWLAAQGDLHLGEQSVRVIRTPGHTPGSVCFLIGGVLFSGDTLFKGSVGRTPDDDSARRMTAGIREKLLVLPADTLIFPGHYESTTIGEARVLMQGTP